LLPSRSKVTPAVALHDVEDYLQNDHYLSASSLQSNDFHCSIPLADRIQLVPANEADNVGASTRKSHDISHGGVIGDATQFITQKQLTFVKIPDTLAVIIGMKIGMAVYFTIVK
jgi:hypothetical protein